MPQRKCVILTLYLCNTKRKTLYHNGKVDFVNEKIILIICSDQKILFNEKVKRAFREWMWVYFFLLPVKALKQSFAVVLQNEYS